jgi:hypothetical protein
MTGVAVRLSSTLSSSSSVSHSALRFGGEDLLGQVEDGFVDDGVVRLEGDDVAEVDFAEVHAVGEHVRDGLVAPWLCAGCGVGLAVCATAVQAAVVEGWWRWRGFPWRLEGQMRVGS